MLILGKSRLNPLPKFFYVEMIKFFHICIIPFVYIVKGAILFNLIKKRIYFVQEGALSFLNSPSQGLGFPYGKGYTNVRIVAAIQQSHIGICYGYLGPALCHIFDDLFCGGIVFNLNRHIKAIFLQFLQPFLVGGLPSDTDGFSLQVVNAVDL